MTRSLLFLAAGVAVFAVGVQQFLRVRSDVHHSVAPGVPHRSPTKVRDMNTVKTKSSHRYAVQIAVDGLNFTFRPADITVARGSTITWVSRTASPHTVTSVTRKLFDVPVRGHGTAEITFHAPGTYQYFCALHPYMVGVVHVR